MPSSSRCGNKSSVLDEYGIAGAVSSLEARGVIIAIAECLRACYSWNNDLGALCSVPFRGVPAESSHDGPGPDKNFSLCLLITNTFKKPRARRDISICLRGTSVSPLLPGTGAGARLVSRRSCGTRSSRPPTSPSPRPSTTTRRREPWGPMHL